MTTIEIDEFRRSLERKQNELESRSHNRQGLAVETSSDELDRIQGAQERDLAIGGFDRDARLLREVRYALARIVDGTFGRCPDCEEDISLKRLKAVPWTTLCIVCQESADNSAVGDGHRSETFSVSAA